MWRVRLGLLGLPASCGKLENFEGWGEAPDCAPDCMPDCMPGIDANCSWGACLFLFCSMLCLGDSRFEVPASRHLIFMLEEFCFRGLHSEEHGWLAFHGELVYITLYGRCPILLHNKMTSSRKSKVPFEHLSRTPSRAFAEACLSS